MFVNRVCGTQRPPCMAHASALAICALCAASASRVFDEVDATLPTPAEVFQAMLASSSSFFTNNSQEIDARVDKPSDYWVFIKSTPLVWLASASMAPSHTELALCARRKERDKREISEKVKYYVKTGRSCLVGLCGFLSHDAVRALADLLPQCTVLSYTSDQGIVVFPGNGPDDQIAYGCQPQNGVSMTWVGEVQNFHIFDFKRQMEECGNWDAASYNILANNCNMFSDAALKGMGLSTDFRFLSTAEGPMVREPGYVDTRTKQCKGMYCTAFGDPTMTGCGPCTAFEEPRQTSSKWFGVLS